VQSIAAVAEHEPSATIIHASPTPETGQGDFSSFVKHQTTLAELFANFGDADPQWKQKVIVEEDEDEDETGTSLATEKIKNTTTTTNSARTTTTSSNKTEKKSASKLSRLAIKGKAPIHVSLESFGYVHGAPSRHQREVSGSPYAQPLGILEMDQTILDPVPAYLDFHDGLKSGVVKRMLKAAPLVAGLDANHQTTNTTNSTNEEKKTTTAYTHLNDYCKRYIVDTQIYPSLVEAIMVGGHGWIHPVTMTYPIGSYLGRHRSVVAVELSAVHLRNALRHNTHPALAACTVSVGTVHRDIKKRIPQKIYKEDYDDEED